ncbi:hypothetical protein EVAR_52606_1 [Eumeta japonica]|uniref:Uncharacterized protein n=1 Tax=Eumeta variegata TaxID=151549 RepID=A0A4C1YR67_EUMVA|nr:hypothetical protein EVAR_52606_1 [Eumeta japonica]
MNHINIKKQTLKALHQAKKTENGRQMEETRPFPLYLLTHSIYYPSLIQFLAKGCTNTGWLYKLPSLPIQNRTYTPPDIYAAFGVSGLVPFSHCDWLKVER